MGYEYKEIIFCFPNMTYILKNVLLLAATFLLLIYLWKFYSCGKNKILFTVILGLISVYSLIRVLDYATNYMLVSIWTIFFLGTAVLCTLFAIFWQIGSFNKKAFIIISIVFISIFECLSLWSIIKDIELYLQYSLYLFQNLFYFIGFASLLLTPFIFVLKNAIPDWKKEKIASSMPSPEEELFALNEKLELGIITEEEYQALREEIIQRL